MNWYAPDALALGRVRGEIAFDRVGFAYGRGAGGIEGLSLTVAPGERIGIVGASGAGKSTLVALLPVDHLLDRVETQAWQELARILAHEMMNSLTPITSLAANVRPIEAQ